MLLRQISFRVQELSFSDDPLEKQNRLAADKAV